MTEERMREREGGEMKGEGNYGERKSEGPKEASKAFFETLR